jgi:hypothetical protein
VTGLLISTVILVAAVAIAWAVRNLREELRPTENEFRAFGTQVRPALIRVQDATDAARRRLPRA